jgi:hypothetical protein
VSVAVAADGVVVAVAVAVVVAAVVAAAAVVSAVVAAAVAVTNKTCLQKCEYVKYSFPYITRYAKPDK